ncbi:hypothetical protein GALMADRAFT_1131553 [Galerina marginata CBS 339.88]|uniref:Uncharacterized protein n=1 Tax=Galerina marginata (strain CBS 339.88) TaxID=685588 RepID=A0A067SJR1_GALM3|nr:hypothetical protein GALMADRAFT_1131553 [Galerina marginata CBS 339.88]
MQNNLAPPISSYPPHLATKRALPSPPPPAPASTSHPASFCTPFTEQKRLSFHCTSSSCLTHSQCLRLEMSHKPHRAPVPFAHPAPKRRTRHTSTKADSEA